jgi:hypothetical protein
MIFKINDDYRLSADATCITLEKKRVIEKDTKHHKAGDEVYDAIGYYGEFEHAYRALAKHGIMSSELEGLQAIIERLDRIEQAVRESLKGGKA